jgi:hypothetical protein
VIVGDFWGFVGDFLVMRVNLTEDFWGISWIGFHGGMKVIFGDCW